MRVYKQTLIFSCSDNPIKHHCDIYKRAISGQQLLSGRNLRTVNVLLRARIVWTYSEIGLVGLDIFAQHYPHYPLNVFTDSTIYDIWTVYLKNISLSSKVAYFRVTGLNFIQVQCKSIQSIIKPIRSVKPLKIFEPKPYGLLFVRKSVNFIEIK